MKQLALLLAVITQLAICGGIENSTEATATKHKATTLPNTLPKPTFSIDPLQVHRTTFHAPDGKVSCSISTADDSDALQLTDDNFGYPKFMVEEEFQRNKVATMMFDMYLRHPKQNGGNINLHLENTASISQAHQPNQQIVQNPFTGNGLNNALGGQSNLFGNQFPASSFHNNHQNFANPGNVHSQMPTTDNNQPQFTNTNNNGIPQHQNSGFKGFDFSDSIANTRDKANIVSNGFHFPSSGIPLFRKKRMSGFQTSFTGFTTPGYLCQSKMTILRRYKGHSGKCYLIEPEVQNVHFASCSKAKCSSCNDFTGVTQCSPETKDIWVWAYCDNLPQGKKVIYDKIKIPTHCACKTFTC